MPVRANLEAIGLGYTDEARSRVRRAMVCFIGRVVRDAASIREGTWGEGGGGLPKGRRQARRGAAWGGGIVRHRQLGHTNEPHIHAFFS